MSIEAVWRFWFEELDAAGRAKPEVIGRWFKKDDALDRRIREEFLALHGQISAGAHEAWRSTMRGAVAYVVVLDQLSRNMFRGTAEMFASDARGLAAAKDAVARGLDLEAPFAARTFLYVPYMHSESLADQDTCVALFQTLEGAENNLDYAERHRAIVRRFGRFPHRNAILGRPSTPEEEAFLQEPGSSF